MCVLKGAQVTSSLTKSCQVLKGISPLTCLNADCCRLCQCSMTNSYNYIALLYPDNASRLAVMVSLLALARTYISISPSCSINILLFQLIDSSLINQFCVYFVNSLIDAYNLLIIIDLNH